MTKVNSEEYNKALEEYLQECIGWDAGLFDINAKNNQGDYEQFAADSFHAGWQAANESEGKCNICSVSQRSGQFSLKQLWIMAQKLNMSDFKQMVEEIERLNCG